MNNRKRNYKKALDNGFKYWFKKIFDLFSLNETIVMNTFVHFILDRKIPLYKFFKENQYVRETPKCEIEMPREIYSRYWKHIYLFIMDNFNTKNMKIYYNIENQMFTCEWVGIYKEYWYKYHSNSTN